MRAVVQRVSQADVKVDGETIGEIGSGLLVLVGVTEADDQKAVEYLANKILGLRIFEDDQGLMNLSVEQIAGELLIVSQFTLFGDCRRGRRPSFEAAARPEQANQLYESLVQLLKLSGLKVATGRFRAEMKVSLLNDGPVTLLLDSEKTF